MQRKTRQRAAIRWAFERAGRPLRPQECLELRVVELPGSPDRYETAGRCHHHHFHCRRCDGVFEVETCPGGFAAMAPSGYRVEDHELILYGVCRSCVS